MFVYSDKVYLIHKTQWEVERFYLKSKFLFPKFRKQMRRELPISLQRSQSICQNLIRMNHVPQFQEHFYTEHLKVERLVSEI